MDYNKITDTALSRYFTRLTQIGYYPDEGVYNLVALSILTNLIEFLTEEDIEYCKLNSIIRCLTSSTCLTSGLNKLCPDISNPVSVLATI